MDLVFKNENLKILLLIVITLVVYIPAIHGGYIWDDNMYVTLNHTLRSLSGLAQIWLEPQTTPQYYPLVFSSFWLEYRMWGLDPTGYHIVNVLLHASVAVALYYALRYLELPGAWPAALVFAIHPVHVESVAWITERKNVLSGLFYLCSLLSFFKFFHVESDKNEENIGGRWYYLIGIMMFICALLSKSVTSTLPVAIILVLWWKRGRVTIAELLYLSPLIILGISAGLWTAWLEKTHVGAQEINWGLTLIGRCLIAGRALWFYLWKLLWPLDLTFNYPRWKIDDGIWWQYAYPLSFIGISILFWRTRGAVGRGPLAALLFFAVSLFPALGFIDVFPFRYSFVADHFQYLASIGVIVLVASGGARLVKTLSSTQQKTFTIAALLVVSLLGIKSWNQEHIYKDIWELWGETLKMNPESALAHNNFGMELSQQGKHQEAMAHFYEALKINPNMEEIHYNLGVELAAQGKTEEARQHFYEALRIYPKDAKALNNLGALLLDEGRINEALSYFTLSIQSDPNHVAAHCNLFRTYQLIGKTEKANQEYSKIKTLDPEVANRLLLIGNPSPKR